MTHWRLSALFAALLALVSGPAQALDAPHDASNLPQVCATCHTHHDSLGSVLTSRDTIENLCLSCHYDGGPVPPRAVVHTHKSSSTAGGDFDFQHVCSDCHDPHSQDQPSFPGGIGGQFIRAEIPTPSSGTKTITLTARSGAGGLADGDSTINGICEVCHTLTTHYTNSVAEAGKGAPHQVGQDCTTCHMHRNPDDLVANGFAPVGGDSCLDCHNDATGSRRSVFNDFDLTTSHHVARDLATKPLNDYDCVLCHLEGDENKELTEYHNDALYTVNLRNVDDPTDTSLTWQDPDVIDLDPNGAPATCDPPNERTKLTMFCLGCHDANGVGDATLIATLDARDTAVTRTATDPFGSSSAVLDVASQMDPAAYSSHSVSCYLDTSAAGCGTECAGGTHNDQATGSCVPDESCSPDPCPGASVCSVLHGEESCECPLNWSGAACDTCSPGYSGVDCTLDTCTVDGASCADGHGTCAFGDAGEQYTWSDAASGWTGSTWTSTASGSANGGTARKASSSTATYSRSVTTSFGPSGTYAVWATCANSGSGSVSMSVSIDGSTVGSLSCRSFGWQSVGSVSGLSAGTHTVAVTCTGGSGSRFCLFDGLMMSTVGTNPSSASGFTPYTTANWDASALSYYTDGGATCVCATGYVGSDCATCDTGYHIEDGACVPDSGGACAGVDCDGNGTCYIASDPLGDVSNTFAVCDCTEQYYGTTKTSCAQCTDYFAGTWMSGQTLPASYPPGIKCGSWEGADCADPAAFGTNSGWDQASTTECADCHMPGDTSVTAAVPYSNNAHGSLNNNYLMDDYLGEETPELGASNGTGMTVVCVKCHNVETYAYNGANLAYGRFALHNKSAHMDDTDNIFGNACLNCHGGGTYGTIHGRSTMQTDDGTLGSYAPYFFLDGAGIDYWSNSGGSVTCSSRKSVTTTNLGCTQHTSQSYTRGY